jgi:hypothetical protein
MHITMKKIMYSTIALTCFSLAMVLFQISCRDNVVAQNTGSQALNKILYYMSNDMTGENKFWIANNDGTNIQEIPVTLPIGFKIKFGGNGRLTLDGKTMIFTVENSATPKAYFLYSVLVDGTNLKKLVDGPVAGSGGGLSFGIVQTY